MVKINALFFLFIVEFLVASIGLSIFLLMRSRRLDSKVNASKGDTLNKIKEEGLRCEKELEGVKSGKGDMLEKNALLSRLHFIQMAISGLNEDDADYDPFWAKAYKGFSEVSNKYLNTMKKSQNEKIALLQQIKGYRHLLDQVQGRFSEIQKGNVKLKDKLTVLLPDAERSEELKKMIVELEGSFKDMDNCVVVMETENKHLQAQAAGFEAKIENLMSTVEQSVDNNTHETLVSEHNSLKQQVTDLENELKDKDKAYESIKHNIESLEREYLALYEKHQGTHTEAEMEAS